MRVLWLLLLAAAASGFEVGKEYVYEYKGTMHVLNPEQRHQLTGLGFRSKVIMQPKPDHTHFKIVNFEADTFNSDEIDLAHHEFHYASNENLHGALEQPFAGKFDEGKIVEIEIGKSEPTWVRNVKKGVLSLFQLDLVKGRHEHHDEKEYHVKEDGLHGPCETLYVVHEEEHGYLEVTKVKNLEKCDHHHIAKIGVKVAKNCLKCHAEEPHPYSSTSEVYYELKGTAQHYEIAHAWAESGYLFKPNGEGKKIHVKLNRTLDLLEEHDATTETPLAEDVEKEHSLAQEFPTTGDLKTHEELLHPNAAIKHFDVKTDLKKFAEGLHQLAELEYTDDDIKEIDNKASGSQLFLVLFRSFSGFDYDEVHAIYQNHVQAAPAEAKDSILHAFLDLLAACGNNPHVTFGLNLIKNNEITAKDARRFYGQLHLNLKEVSTAMIHEIADSCKSEPVKSNPGTWSACKFAASTAAGARGCKHAHDDHEEDHGTCSPEIASHIFNYSVTPAETHDESEFKSTVYLRVAGNLGTRKAMHYLERFICPKWHASEPKRMAALWALKQASKNHPHLAHSIALPIFYNTSEPSELRIASFLVVLFSHPELYLLRHIAREMVTEPSDQVVAFVSSAFRSLAKSKYPCHRELAQQMRYVLPEWDHDTRFRRPIDKASSHLIISSTYSPKYDYGGMTSSVLIRSHDSYLPRNMYIMLRDYKAGHNFDTLTLQFESWGMDKTFNHLLGPQPGSTKNLWNFMGRRRIPRDASAKERKEIEDSLHIADREYDPMYARLSLSIFGKTVDTYSIDENILATFQQKDKPEEAVQKLLGAEVRKKYFYLTKDVTVLMPSELGVPVIFDFKQAEFIYGKREKMGLTHGDNAEINLDIKRHYLYDVASSQMFGFAPEFTKLGIGTGYSARTVISWPLDLKATLAPLEGKLSLRRPLHLPWNVINHNFLPFTFVMPFDINTDASHAMTEFFRLAKPLYRPEELTQFDRHYFDDTFGVGLNVKGHLISKGLHRAVREVYHEMSCRERFYYMAVNPHWHPRDIKIYALPAAQDPTTELDIDISYKFLEPDDERHSHFNVHDQIADDPEVPSTHVLKLDVNFKGESKERKASAELRYSFNHDLFNHKLQFFYDRTPFSHADTEGLKICLAASAKFPKPDWSVTNLATFYAGHHIDAHLDVHYGSTCEAGSSITINGKFTHTDEDEQQLAAAAEGKAVGRNRFGSTFLHWLANKCHQHQEKGIQFSHYCYRLLRYSSRLGKFTADVEWKNYKSLLNRLAPYYAKRYAYKPWKAGFLGVVRSYFTGDHGKLHVVSQVPWWRVDEKPYTNMIVTTEDGHHHEHWEVPTFSKILEPRIFSVTGYSNAAEYSKLYRHKYCDLQSHSVRTFDGTVVHLPETDCYKVVARDCSPNKRFLVLARATNNPTLTKAVKLFIDTTMIEILPLDGESGLVVRVDGNKVDIAAEHPYSHTSHDVELFRIKKEATKWYKLDSESYGLHLGFGGNMLVVEVATFYRGKLCGLCGDYNLDKNHELSGPDGHLYNNTLEFAKSYVVPSADCHPPAH
ncbi:vitellogenin-6-like [Dermacentor andersoni]|uniref:vitellogenin-6-like n=1 Tax=Dermacentor andersoni TaxID=34620 RepID=UPI0021555AA9|nr:hemolymph clottable protein-like [Dermacentor andersoni]